MVRVVVVRVIVVRVVAVRVFVVRGIVGGSEFGVVVLRVVRVFVVVVRGGGIEEWWCVGCVVGISCRRERACFRCRA